MIIEKLNERPPRPFSAA